MAASDKRLGRGLDALFRHTAEPVATEDVTKLALRFVFPNPDQPRKHFSDEGLTELAASIKEHGVLQPILVRPMPEDKMPEALRGRYHGQTIYQIIAGERRWKASQLAGLVEVPVVVRQLSDQETLAVALIENLQREDLNPMEEARALYLLRETFQFSQEDLARQLGKSRSAIANILRLLQLPESMHADVASGMLSAGHARALLSVTDAAVQAELHQRMLSNSLTVRDAEDAVSHWKEKGVLPKSDVVAYLVAAAQTEHALDSIANGAQGTEFGGSAALELTEAQATPATHLQRNPRRKAPKLKRLQKRLTEHLGMKASVSGTESKGKITLSYSNADDFQLLMLALGLDIDADD